MTSPDPHRLLHAPEVATVLGISLQMLNRGFRTGRIPGYRLRRWWFAVYADVVSEKPSDEALDELLDELPDMVTANDLSRLFNVSRQTIGNWIGEGLIQGAQTNKRWLILKSDLRRALEESRNTPQAASPKPLVRPEVKIEQPTTWLEKTLREIGYSSHK